MIKLKIKRIEKYLSKRNSVFRKEVRRILNEYLITNILNDSSKNFLLSLNLIIIENDINKNQLELEFPTGSIKQLNS